MKTVSITKARHKLGELSRAPSTVEVTHRGATVGTLRIYAEAHYDREKAMEAARGIRELSLRLNAKRKPSKKRGATKAVRDLRDGD